MFRSPENTGSGEPLSSKVGMNDSSVNAAKNLAGEFEMLDRRGKNEIASDYEAIKSQIATLEAQIEEAVDKAAKNEGGLGKVHQDIGRQLVAEKAKLEENLKTLGEELKALTTEDVVLH